MVQYNLLRMVRNVIVIVCLLLLTVSCGRKSGRRSTSSTTQNYQTSQSATPQQSTSSITNKRERDTQVSANKKILTPTELFAKYNSAVFMIYTSDGYQGAQEASLLYNKLDLAIFSKIALRHWIITIMKKQLYILQKQKSAYSLS